MGRTRTCARVPPWWDMGGDSGAGREARHGRSGRRLRHGRDRRAGQEQRGAPAEARAHRRVVWLGRGHRRRRGAPHGPLRPARQGGALCGLRRSRSRRPSPLATFGFCRVERPNGEREGQARRGAALCAALFCGATVWCVARWTVLRSAALEKRKGCGSPPFARFHLPTCSSLLFTLLRFASPRLGFASLRHALCSMELLSLRCCDVLRCTRLRCAAVLGGVQSELGWDVAERCLEHVAGAARATRLDGPGFFGKARESCRVWATLGLTSSGGDA